MIRILVFISCVSTCLGWNTLYSYTDGKSYLHLKNNDLVSLNFSITGVDSAVDLTNNQKVTAMAAPPENSTLFLVVDQLYGFIGSSNTSSTTDVCGEGVLSLVKYDSSKDSWDDVGSELNMTAVSDSSYYLHPTVLTDLENSNSVYLYGGICQSTGEVTSRMLSLDLTSMKFSNITTSTKPQAFYGAANLAAPNPQTQLTIGGESNEAWLSMYQLATWDFDAGWSVKSISHGSGGTSNSTTSVNARRFPLALPIFTALDNSSISTVSSLLSIEKVMVVGGELADGDALPTVSTLSLETNNWYWNSTFQSSLNVDDILGAATIFNSLVVINGSTSGISKRGASTYTISLYDTTTLKSVTTLAKNYDSIMSSTNVSSNKSIDKKAILGSVIPICAILLIVAVVGYIIRRRRIAERLQRQQEEMNEIDYQFSTYMPKPSENPYDTVRLSNSIKLSAKERRKHLMNINNDTSSTIDAHSFDSWYKKREEFDRSNVVRDSYLASQETLHEQPRVYDEGEKDELETLSDSDSIRILSHANASPLQPHNSIVNRSVSMIKKSLSFANPSAEYEDLRRKSMKLPALPPKQTSGVIPPPAPPARRVSGNRNVNGGAPRETSPSRNVFASPLDDVASIGKEGSDSESSLDDKMDVQVLVSSKRRSVLRVVNPDLSTIHDGEENENSDDNEGGSAQTTTKFGNKYKGLANTEPLSIRQRIPSGAKMLDD